MITLTGLTAQQREIADHIWSLDTREAVEQYIYGLPLRLRLQAWIVMQMIIAAELDQVMEVSDDVQSYIASL